MSPWKPAESRKRRPCHSTPTHATSESLGTFSPTAAQLEGGRRWGAGFGGSQLRFHAREETEGGQIWFQVSKGLPIFPFCEFWGHTWGCSGVSPLPVMEDWFPLPIRQSEPLRTAKHGLKLFQITGFSLARSKEGLKMGMAAWRENAGSRSTLALPPPTVYGQLRSQKRLGLHIDLLYFIPLPRFF